MNWWVALSTNDDINEHNAIASNNDFNNNMLQGNEGGDESQPDVAPATPALKSNILSVQSPRQRSVKIWEEDEKKYDDGYDSDGEQGPFFDTINIEGEQDFDEDKVLK